MNPEKRTGWKTTEFRSMLVFMALVIANGTPYISIPESQVAMIAALVFGYGGGRLLLKNTLAKGKANETPATA